LVEGSFFDRFVNKGEGLGKEFLGSFAILVFEGLPQLFYLTAENGFVSPIYSIPAKTSPPLAYG